MEGGVSWSRAGPVATGTLLAGLAAAMEPKNVDWLPYNQGGIMIVSEKSSIFKSVYVLLLSILSMTINLRNLQIQIFGHRP